MSYQAFRNRVNREGKYSYNRALKKYELIESHTCEFLSIEELTLKRKTSHVDTPPATNQNQPDALEYLLQDLIKDRLLEYSSFIRLDRHTKQVCITFHTLKAKDIK